MPIQFHRCQVESNTKLAEKFLCLRSQVLDPNFTFTAGQFIVLKIAPTTFRDYSISTTPKILPYWETIVDISPCGPGSQYIKNLQKGDTIEIAGPSGAFTIETLSEHIIFVATGSGISSTKSLLEQLFEDQASQKIYLFWGLRYLRDLFYQDLLASWAKTHPNFNYQIVLSRPEGEWAGKTGHVTEHVASLLPSLIISPQRGNSFRASRSEISLYLCGNSGMINDVSQTALTKGITKDHIHYEQYYK